MVSNVNLLRENGVPESNIFSFLNRIEFGIVLTEKKLWVTADGFHGMGDDEGSGSRRWCDGVERRWQGGDQRQQ